jgi:hypothetical protein
LVLDIREYFGTSGTLAAAGLVVSKRPRKLLKATPSSLAMSVRDGIGPRIELGLREVIF